MMFAGAHFLAEEARHAGVVQRSVRAGQTGSGTALRKVAPDLDAKKRAKYAAVVRFLVAKMPPEGNVKAFVRENDGLNGCVAKEKGLRKRGDRKRPKR